MDILTGLFAGIGGAAGVWAAMRFLAPRIGSLLGKFWAARIQLDNDRDRVTAGLRAEIDDLYRRIEAEKLIRAEAEKKYANYRESYETSLATMTEKLRVCEAAFARYIKKEVE